MSMRCCGASAAERARASTLTCGRNLPVRAALPKGFRQERSAVVSQRTPAPDRPRYFGGFAWTSIDANQAASASMSASTSDFATTAMTSIAALARPIKAKLFREVDLGLASQMRRVGQHADAEFAMACRTAGRLLAAQCGVRPARGRQVRNDGRRERDSKQGVAHAGLRRAHRSAHPSPVGVTPRRTRFGRWRRQSRPRPGSNHRAVQPRPPAGRDSASFPDRATRPRTPQSCRPCRPP